MVGAGPAGSVCAAHCARAGLATVLLERSVFPREKVCGDCMNPGCWDILDRLEVAEEVLAQPHAKLRGVEFIGMGGRSTRYAFKEAARGEIAIKRSLLDHVLLRRAAAWGAEVRQGVTVEAIERAWKVSTREEGVFETPLLVAADGRNSTVARLAGLLPAPAPERVAVQTHTRPPAEPGNRVRLRFLPGGYCGFNDIGGGELNLCLVGPAANIPRLKAWAASAFPLSAGQTWRTIAPLARAPAPCAPGDGLLLAGDAARVLEPFTGEGIYYALASGELAARSIIRWKAEGDGVFGDYRREHARLYSGRLWINRLARAAVLSPRIGSMALDALSLNPRVLRFLTARVLGAGLVE